MGIEIWALRTLTDYKQRISGRFLMLGRQEIHLIGPQFEMDGRVAEQLKMIGVSNFDYSILKGYAEDFCRWLGADAVDSMDFSPYEQATIVHDLNDPIPDELKESFDVIFDGGTLEHVYDFPRSIDNVKAMLKQNGIFISVTVANNFLGHGFYQFSPELMWRVFNKGGFRVLSVRLTDGYDTCREMPDPEAEGSRQFIGCTDGATYMIVVAEKVSDCSSEKILQSDYVPIWNRKD